MAFVPRAAPPRPPLKGSFPLDHEGECKSEMRAYMACLTRERYDATRCREDSLRYLQCRMDRGLMVPEDPQKLGFEGNSKDSK